MAYDSDGYIMIDFTKVDFRRTNQTIEGLFDRCQKVIGANKFVIVINANNKTPLPSTVSITNGQYVIESVLYTFSISAADNLHITKKTNADELIDDDHVTLKTTFSSDKIMSLLDNSNYSTTEHKVGNWIDGSPVYERTISFGALPDSTTKIIDTISDIKEIINFEGYAVSRTSPGYCYPLPFSSNPASSNIRIDFRNYELRIITYDFWSSYDGYITIRYTKNS